VLARWCWAQRSEPRLGPKYGSGSALQPEARTLLVLDEGPKVPIGNLHPGMGRLHIAPAVGAGPSCCHTDVIDKVALSFRISVIAHRPSILVSAATLANN